MKPLSIHTFCCVHFQFNFSTCDYVVNVYSVDYCKLNLLTYNTFYLIGFNFVATIMLGLPCLKFGHYLIALSV